ncbi:MAG: PIN domain-containing protein [Woeseiaceae bacterium]|jgi:predicted nucleic acid-binding protein
MKATLLDTGVIVALIDRDERHHVQCVETVSDLIGPLVTCEAVVAEACYLLRRTPGAPEAVIKNVANGVFQTPVRLADQASAVELTPDQVKCKLVSSARPAVKADGSLAYSVFQQGAGMVDAHGAVNSANLDCANRGMDINQDIDGQVHYGGPANVDENGNYYIMGLEGYLWTNSLTESASVNHWVDQE